ncbi:MAG: hypothetical protein HQL39_16325 [Alphaproteobacteria bacterium]|nr:hypothetical protein [Alphaproteobacteria bacterium]
MQRPRKGGSYVMGEDGALVPADHVPASSQSELWVACSACNWAGVPTDLTFGAGCPDCGEIASGIARVSTAPTTPAPVKGRTKKRG